MEEEKKNQVAQAGRAEEQSPERGDETDRRDGSGQSRCMVTERDRDLLALMSITRYLTTKQANALVRPGRDESVGRRRLFTLAGLAPRARGRRRQEPVALFDPPLVRRLMFRSTTGERVSQWALTRQGEALAAAVLGRDPRLERRDVSEPFREHWAVLTDLFVGIAAPLLARGLKPRDLPLKWDPCETTDLPWREYDTTAGKVRSRLMVPDAVLDLLAARRRFLIECEMGSHSIVAASDEKAGATLRKAERYDEFFSGLDDASSGLTFYAKAFPDRWPAEVVFLVRTDSRRDRVNAALDRWRAERLRVTVLARALTLADAVAEFRAATGAAAPSAAPPGLPDQDLDVLRRFYQEALLELKAAGRTLPAAFRATALRARTVLSRADSATLPASEEAR